MIEEELIKIWKSSPEPEQVKFEKSRLMLDVQSKVDRLHKEMKWLYLREGLGAIIAIFMFSFYAFIIPYLLTKIAFVLIVLWAAFILYVIKKTKEKIPNQYALNYLDYLLKNREYLEEQKRLRENIFYWYVLPFISFVYLGLLGPYLDHPEKASGLAIIAIVCLLGGITTYLLNKRSAKKFIEPKLEKVNGLIKKMTE
ncbi:MAG: hypothetical protein AAGA31_06795 [Bacteroidota bacterium]